MGWGRLRAGESRRQRGAWLGDRAPDQGGPGPGGQGSRVPRRAAARHAGRPLRGGARPQQSRRSPLLLHRAADREDVRWSARVDLERAGADGARSGCALPQLHLRVRARARHRAGVAAGLPRPDLRGPAQSAARYATRRGPGRPTAPGRRQLAGLLRRDPAERGRDATALPRPAESRRRSDRRGHLAPDRDAGGEGGGVRGGAGVRWLGGRTVGRSGGRFSRQGELRSPDESDRSRPPAARPPPLRTALVRAERSTSLDPTGCGDVFGAAAAARLFAGDQVEAAIRHANGMAARNAAFRGAGGLSRHLRGELVLP